MQLACLLQVKHGCEVLSFPAADDSGNRYLRSEEPRLVHTLQKVQQTVERKVVMCANPVKPLDSLETLLQTHSGMVLMSSIRNNIS